jgi:hypothetical protein
MVQEKGFPSGSLMEMLQENLSGVSVELFMGLWNPKIGG